VTYGVTDAIEKITGSEPETLRQFLQANRERLDAV
jgi:hypothetical protein